MSNHENEIINEYIMEGGKMKHTPIPWRVKQYNQAYIKFTCIESENGRIAKIKHYPHYGDMDANAKFIVKCVNNHERLLEACKDALRCAITDKNLILVAILTDAIKQAESEG